MKSRFHPDCYFRSYHDVRPDLLKKHGIRLLIVDIDNTLVPSHQAHADENAVHFIEELRRNGMETAVVSNNVASRIQSISDELHVSCFPFALKPTRHGYLKAMHAFHVTAAETAVLGDQLLTDIWGGKRMGMLCILVDPLSPKDNFFGAINRVLEEGLFHILEKKHILKKGNYYGKL